MSLFVEIPINRRGYVPFIDFLKAYAIVCVVISHALPKELYDYTLFAVYGGMAVPLFLLIQVFHAYKKDACPIISLGRLIRRIIIPFICVQLIIFFEEAIIKGITVKHLINSILVGGGLGPGSYFPWVYLQMTLLLVILWPMLRRFTLKQLLLPFIVICEGLEIYASSTELTPWIYRLIVIRYLFLIYLGLIWVRKGGIILSKITILLSIATLVITIFFHFNSLNLQPWFYTTEWRTHRYICFFYASNLLIAILWRIYSKCIYNKRALIAIQLIAKSSYEIFLIQMLVYMVVPYILDGIIENGNLRCVLNFIFAVPLSISLGIVFRNILEMTILKKIKNERVN